MARPIATRCRCPPDNNAGRLFKFSVNSRIRAASATRFSISAFGVLANFNANPMFSPTVICGYNA